MPMRWEIDHAHKFVYIVADGPLTREHVEEHFDALFVANAMGYAKLVDVTNARPIYNDDDVMLMGARLSAYTAELPSGPLAVVGKPSLRNTFKLFVALSPSDRPAKYFPSEEKARAWLAEITSA